MLSSHISVLFPSSESFAFLKKADLNLTLQAKCSISSDTVFQPCNLPMVSVLQPRWAIHCYKNTCSFLLQLQTSIVFYLHLFCGTPFYTFVQQRFHSI